MVTVIFIMVLLYIILFTVGVISYAFNSIGLDKIARREEKPPFFLAWIPYLNNYALGKIAFHSNLHAFLMTSLSVFALLFSIAVFFVRTDFSVLFSLALSSFLFSATSAVYTFIARYKVYDRYSKSTILMTVLDVISLGILGPFFIFAIRNNDTK